jgi:ring-1,2-phenylacetyl-CoA epoxidase subunit PaaC
VSETALAADRAAAYVLGLGDDALVYAQRLGEWVSRAPQVEEDMAFANTALDLIGQARRLYTRAGELDGSGRSEDDYAMFRDEREFRNVHLVEQPRGDFGREMARMLWFSTYQHALYGRLASSSDDVVAGIAAKAVKEASYHVTHASTWVVRLGDGTEESRARMAVGMTWAAPYVDELFADDDASVAAAESGLGVLPSTLRPEVDTRVSAVVAEATLTMPSRPSWTAKGGRSGVHSEAMGYVLADMQHIARSFPGATW